MKTSVYVQVRTGQGAEFSLNLTSFGLTMETAVAAAGGRCLPFWNKGILTLAVQGISPSHVESLPAPLIATAQKQGRSLSIVQTDAAVLPQAGLPASFSGPGSIVRKKLTRKFLFSLPAGAYVVSNIYPNGRSAFAEMVGDVRTRDEAWKRAVAAAATQRLCQVVWTAEEFRQIQTASGLSLGI